jgi:hypothetical protein
MVTINYFAVIAATVACQAIGFAWYGPVFGKLWMKLSGITEKQIAEKKKKGMCLTFALSALSSLLMAYVLAHFVDYVGATTIGGALQLAFWIWLGFIATVALGSVLWEGKSWQLYGLNIAYYIVTLSVMASILAVWV